MYNVCYVRLDASGRMDGVQVMPFHKLSSTVFPPTKTYAESHDVLVRLLGEYEEYQRQYDEGHVESELLNKNGFGTDQKKFQPENSLGICSDVSPFVMVYDETNFADIDYDAIQQYHGSLFDDVGADPLQEEYHKGHTHGFENDGSFDKPEPRSHERIQKASTEPETLSLAERMRNSKKK